MRRFFVNPNQINDQKAEISGEEFKHMTQVLRCKTGDTFVLLDGSGFEYTSVITDVLDNSVIFDVINKQYSESESAVHITLYQGMPKAQKLETIIQKATELGVYAVVPFVAARSIKLPEKNVDKKTERMQRIAKEAVKQSRRAIVPKISPPITFKHLSEQLIKYDLIVLCDEHEKSTTLKEALSCNTGNSIALIIGPEGGFEPSEINSLMQCGANPITLGKRILRTETAGPAAIAMIMYERDCV